MKVPGEGPKPCDLLFCGEGPGYHEAQKGRPFVEKAPAGKEFKRYHENIHIYRPDIYVTNLVKERVPDDGDPTPEDISRDEVELLMELREVNPKIVVPMGAPATRYFLGDNVNMEAVHGIPHNGKGFTVLPAYHPAAGLHDQSGKMQSLIAYDFQQLAALIKGDLAPHPVIDDIKNPCYEEVGPKDVYGSLVSRTQCAVDTEGLKGRPWGLSFSVNRGTGWVIRKHSLALQAFQDVWGRDEMEMILHNALHDLPVLEEMGVVPKRFTDTMLKAYLLCLEPQGLKVLAYRHLGIEMESYADITREASQRLALDYLTNASIWAWTPAVQEVIFKEGVAKLTQPWSINKRIERILKDVHEKGADARARWNSIKKKTPELTLPVELQLGEMLEATLDDIPQSIAVKYSARDADVTGRLDPILDEKIHAMGLEEVLKIDLDIIPMVARMQKVGMLADKEYFERFGRELGHELEELTTEIQRVGGLPISPTSGDQKAELLFHHLGLESHKLTKGKTREAVDVKVLEGLRGKHPVVPLLLDHSERSKLKNTYSDKLPLWMDDDGRIRAICRITRVPSGRLAMSQPNLLAIPTRTPLGQRVREGFIAPPGKLLGSWDLNQIEMRVLAHESQDENLMAVLSDPARPGIHIETCASIYGKKWEDISKKSTEYKMIKNVTFGVVYDISAYGLTGQMHQRGFPDWTDDDSQKMIDEWFALYPGVLGYMSATRAEARRFGFVRDMFGRIRYLEGVRSQIPKVRKEAERQAINHKIQSGAQGVIKLAMAGVWNDVLPLYWNEGSWIEPLLQVHDEIVFEFDEGLEKTLDPMIKAQMEGAHKLRVPVTASGAWGINWKQLK